MVIKHNTTKPKVVQFVVARNLNKTFGLHYTRQVHYWLIAIHPVGETIHKVTVGNDPNEQELGSSGQPIMVRVDVDIVD